MMSINATRRAALPVLLASGLLLNLAIHPAAAEGELGTPQLHSLRLEPPNAYLEFTDNSAEEDNYLVIVYERDTPDNWTLFTVQGVPGDGRVVTRTVSGIPAGVPLCGKVQAKGGGGSVYPTYKESEWSNIVCTDPAVEAAKPDIAVWGIDGPQDQQWSQVRDIPFYSRYRVEFSNEGADANGTVVVDVQAGDNITIDRVPNTWRDGFTCAPKPKGFQCTGGTLKHGERRLYAIPMVFTRPGFGEIFAEASLAGQVESDTSNNRATLSLQTQ